MPLNLIFDPWIPVIRRDGTTRTIAPWEMTDLAILRPNWPRADLNLACYELLIGLVFLADPPTDGEEWEERQAPDPERLRAHLDPLGSAFNLIGHGPLFLQDMAQLEGAPNPPDLLFIDSAGANTAKNNADLMVRRGRYPALDLPLAAMALYAFQAFAPSGGAGNRTSMRGGGPLVTLTDPGQGLWPLIWANVPYGQLVGPQILPWMRPTVTSENDAKVWPEQAHPAEAFFGMPRRLRLIEDGEVISGVIQRPYGTDYAGWVHPLSPYYRMKAGEELLPAHPRAGHFGYRNWLGVVASAPQQGLRQRATVVAEWHVRAPDAAATVIVAGWSMDNMKPRDFIWSVQPLVDLPPDRARVLAGMIEAADLFSLSLRQALRPVLAEGEAREVVREAFYVETQPKFEARLADLAAGAPLADVTQGWLADMRKAALPLFEGRALAGLDQRETDVQRAIVQAHRNLVADFAGRGTYGKKALALLETTPASREAEEVVV